jgi:hypothetical protein
MFTKSAVLIFLALAALVMVSQAAYLAGHTDRVLKNGELKDYSHYDRLVDNDYRYYVRGSYPYYRTNWYSMGYPYSNGYYYKIWY